MESNSVEKGCKACGGLHCGPGLIIGILACVYFIIILPSGLFLAMVGGPKSVVLLLIGLGCIFIPLLLFLLVCLLMRCRRKYTRATRHVRMSESTAPANV
ncbi:uncharacterized protein [Diadema setosum]|uniref:uncharacterized protein n=1 Tax=Diadema setosum TaxID=31175 RepID=UPI003B3A4F09